MGNAEATVAEAKKISELETPVHTTIVLDNSFSIPVEQRPIVADVLEDLIGNRMQGEKFTIATIADKPTYLCQGETDYLNVKQAIEQIEYQNQATKLTDCLYEILQTLRENEDNTLQRVILITDGVDNQEIGYTREELGELIKKCGYPLYAIGCSNTAPDGNEMLQNLFALSRLTSGETFYLGETQDAAAIASGIAAWNTSSRVEVELPAEVCDGSNRMVKITAPSADGTETSYITELSMPFSLAASGEEVPTETEEPEAPKEPAEQRASSPLPIIIGILLILAAVSIVGVVLYRKKKQKPEFEYVSKEPAVDDGAPTQMDDKTELISAPNEDSDATEAIWNSTTQKRLILVDVNDALRRFEIPLSGRVSVGRAAQCQIVVDHDPKISRHQCDIYEEGGRVMIVNVSTSNITQLNGHSLMSGEELSSGSVITIGLTRLRVEIR